MYQDYMAIGDVEVVNSARLAAYLDTVGSPLATTETCGCPTLTAEMLGHAPYTTPEADAAPWWDPNAPESADFAGLLVLSVDGMDDRPVRRTVTAAVAGGAALGPARVQARTITVTAILLGATCCAVDYGLTWLGAVLAAGDTGCAGDCLTVYNCCPAEDLDQAEFEARHRRTLRRVALVDGPRVIARAGDGCASGECQLGADIVTVEFVLTAATPWLWGDEVPVLDVAPPGDDGAGCVTWCVHPPPGGTPAAGCEGTCRLADCPEPTAACADPSCQPAQPPVPRAPDTCFCLPAAVNAACYELDLTVFPASSLQAPVITVEAGSSDLRRLTITLHERTADHAGLTCEEIADLERCTPHSTYHIGYAPAGSTLTLDGQIRRALIECGGVCETSGDVWGADGSPPGWAELRPAVYCLCIETDALAVPAADATVSVALSGRGA